MSKTRILFINTEVEPYMPSGHLADLGRMLPQAMQESVARSNQTFRHKSRDKRIRSSSDHKSCKPNAPAHPSVFY